MQRLVPEETRCHVLLFQPRWTPPGPDAERLSHGLIPILGSLLAHGCEITLAEEAFDESPGYEGFSNWDQAFQRAQLAIVWCSEMYPAYQILGLNRFIEGLPPGLSLVVGGGFFRVLDPEALEFSDRIQALVLGPGELVLPQLIPALLRPEPQKHLAKVQGIAYRSKAGLHKTPLPKRRPLDPAWVQVLSQLQLKRYTNPAPTIFGNNEPSLQIHGGTGCAKRCPFCFDERNPYGVFPAEAVVEAAAIVQAQTGIRQIAIGELDFFHRIPRALEIAKGFQGFRPKLRWFALGSVSDLCRLGDQDLRLLQESGCHRIEMGSESGSASHLQRLGKRHQVQDILHATTRLRAHGIRTTHNLIFGAPGEEPKDRRATLRLAREIQRRDPDAQLHFRLFQVVPGTTMGEEALGWLPDFPKTLEQLAHFRLGLEHGNRALPWLSKKAEKILRTWVDYTLPLAFHRPHPPNRGILPTTFRALARARARTGLQLGLGVEEGLYRKTIGGLLHTTYLP